MQDSNRLRFETIWTEDGFDGVLAVCNMQTEFEKVAEAYPTQLHQSHYNFAGRRVHMRIVGDELAAHIVRSFSHLQTPEGDNAVADLVIDLWDESLYGRVSWSWDTIEWQETTLKSRDGRFIAQQLPHTFSCLDLQARHLFAAIEWNGKISNYERAKPLARLLLEWYKSHKIQVIHAALVAREGQGVCFVGKSGAGKSTFSLACVSAGFDFLGEDFVGLERRGDGLFIGHSLYNSVFLETVCLARFGTLVRHAIESELPYDEKAVILLSQICPERLARTVPIRALALPRVVDSVQPNFRRASKVEALLALGPSSLLKMSNEELKTQDFDTLVQLVERVPSYWLEVGTSLRSIAPCVRALLNELERKDYSGRT
jgi:hypothetical protein